MYYLLPFRFHRTAGRELIVNEVGDYLVLPDGYIEKIIVKKITDQDTYYPDLIANHFISETPVPALIDNLASRLRTKKAFLDDFTALHIFVLTLRCNQNCVYCQASAKESLRSQYDIPEGVLLRSIDLMFRSPSRHLTMEFQGGESTLVPHLLELGIRTAEEKNKEYGKSITYVLCTNCVNITEEILDICERYKVVISTSLDGPESLHNSNRGKKESYFNTIAGIDKCRERLGRKYVSALMTTSENSLDYPKEIVDCYMENGFNSLFVRALNPYGLAKENDWESYYDRFVDFYKKALDYIIEVNKSGIFFVEEFTALILRKILTPFSIGFVDLQSPAGVINSVVVYNYDGYVYASDESRMLAEFGDHTFRLGSVNDDYKEIFYGEKAKRISEVWTTETIAGCSDCAFQSYCGADPVRNYSTQGDMYGHRRSSWFCRKHKAVIEHIFTLLIEREREVMPVFRNWISNTRG